jgi:hypothetical protein
MERKKVAIIFFGLTRSLSKTIESIRKNIFSPLIDNSIDYDIFIHTYKITGVYKNIWSSEYTTQYKNEDIESILSPKYYIHDNQQEVIDSINFNEYYKCLGNWTGMTPEITKYLIRNMCLALYSKKRIMQIFDTCKDEYNYAIIMRPDLLIKTVLDVRYLNELNNNNIIIPKDDWFTGCNDRLMIGKPDIALYYGNLFNDLKEYSEKKSITSELYLLDKLKEKHIKIIPKNINYDMIRIS